MCQYYIEKMMAWKKSNTLIILFIKTCITKINYAFQLPSEFHNLIAYLFRVSQFSHLSIQLCKIILNSKKKKKERKKKQGAKKINKNKKTFFSENVTEYIKCSQIKNKPFLCHVKTKTKSFKSFY